ncbi:MAG: HAMP domain-containing histidine kinase, partial [Nocardiopsaceae bacterium]|nr:HAMP domain-containing histidine kinase [Nocardiopsaceae bacterium]
MTRRILLALLALTAAVLAGAVIPLALQAVAHERDSFVSSAGATAHSIAVIAEDRLGGRRSDPSLGSAVRIAARENDALLLLDADKRPVVEFGSLAENWRPLAADSSQSGSPVTRLTKTTAIVAEPVWNDGRVGGSPIGLVILERPTDDLDDSITNLWLYLGLLAGGALCAAAGIAVTFARWVNRPLARMDTAARRLADGDLAVRAAAGSGPPELRRMAASFNMMAGRLENLVHGHRAMLADVSHQLRTPLAALRLRIDLLKVDSPPAAAGELADAQEEIARLSRLVDGLLEIARAESVTEQVVSISPVPAVAERVAAWQPVADSHGVKLRSSPGGTQRHPGTPRTPMARTPRRMPDGEAKISDMQPQFGKHDDVPEIALGRGHLEQILDNLLANAIDVLPEGGTVTVSVSGAEGGAGLTGTGLTGAKLTGTRLTVADDGPGMSPAERSRAFLRFASSKQG